MHRRLALLIALAIAGCGGSTASPQPTPPAPAPSDAPDRFDAAADQFYDAHLAFRPHAAIQLGHHDYDGRVPDRSAEAIAAEVARLREARSTFEAFDAADLDHRRELDRQILLAEIRKELFDLEVRERPFRDPLFYLLFDFSLSPYIDRDYAPLADRARALLSACRAAPTYYRQMRTNLRDPLPAPLVGVSGYLLGGTVDLVGTVIRGEMAAVEDEALRGELSTCLDDLVAELADLQKHLAGRMPRATSNFALGEKRFLAMLRETQGIDTDLATLEEIGRADLARNLAALEAAAKAIDPSRSVREVVLEAAADKPAPDQVIAEASEQVARMRAFVVERGIASIPGSEPVEVRPSPPHRRGNMAMLSSAGPFERTALPSYYYLAPPDPSWPEEKQRAYIPSRADLLFLSIHEVWPGHFLQGRHIQHRGSKIMKSFETYSTSEGWAHYVEEMMWDQGAAGTDPRAHIGQLKNALLRNVRFLVAIGLHARGMTVEEAVAMFRDQAFADPGTAQQQAMRGTADPMYLSYTLGKLAIMKLRADAERRAGGSFDLGAFHDQLLSYGEAPLPVIRRLMLGDDAGPVL